MISESGKNLSLSSYSLDKLLPNSLLSSPAVSIRTSDTLADATGLLAHHLESFTDSLVVTKEDHPVGMMGGIELFKSILNSPPFSDKTLISEIMNENIIIISKETTLAELLKIWSQTRRAFAIAPNQYHSYSAISARKLLEIGSFCKTNMRLSNIPKKQIITFDKDYTVKDIIISMFDNNARKLILENTSLFISDRIMAEKLASNLSYLQNVNNFLNMRADIFKLDSAKVISDDLEIPEACKIMYEMLSPYLLTKDQVVSPWDIALILGSENLTDYDWQTRTA